MAPDGFHPAVSAWFGRRFGEPTEPQRAAWPSLSRDRHTLIAAPTGSGKTLAAFLAAIDRLVRRGLDAGGALPDETAVVYVSPLKALSNDVQKNLREPIEGIAAALAERGEPAVAIRTLVRTGDTPQSERQAMVKRPPHVLVTTPESLYILLTSDGGRRMLRTARTVIVDEIHAVLGDKRGSHLALSLERLEDLVRADGGSLTRVGLSATQRPIDEVARFLVGAGAVGADGRADATIVDVGHRRAMDVALELPGSPLEAVLSGEAWTEVYDRLAALVGRHATTLVFVNTRRTAERVARHLAERVGEDAVTAHHGSLSRDHRLDAEQRLKSGRLRALVATASLELGIDIGSVDLVCSIGTIRTIASFLQRVGRSGHAVGATPKGRLFPTSRDELIEAVALLDAVRRGELDRRRIPEAPLDILAQQITAEVACGERGEDELWASFRRAWPYRSLDRAAFDEVVRLLADGFATRRGRRAALLHRDAVHGRLRARRGARLAAITSGGAIPDTAEFRVVLEPSGTFVGTVDEDFAIESLPGNVFQLGNTSWRIRRIEQGRLLVEDAKGEPPNIPFWFGEAPSRSDELSVAVSRLRAEVARRLDVSRDEAVRWLADDAGAGPVAAPQIADYLAAARAALGVMPALDTVVAERFFDEAGDQHLVLHSPYGSRVNRAWGLALRKRFCRTFNFELQAAATEDAIVLSLGPTHSFPLEDVFDYLRAETARDVLVQALLDAPMFTVRWRWNAGRALAILRQRGGRRVPPRLQRMQAEDLIAVAFPDQLACLENIAGDREIPGHPLVRQTIDDCLHEAMDVAGLERLLRGLASGAVGRVARELTEPSPLAHEVLAARPYAFLDDVPLEERRTQAVRARRWIDPREAADLGRLDPAAIARVREEVAPVVRDADELHDALVTSGCLTAAEGEAEAEAWSVFLDELTAARRATRVTVAGDVVLWVAAERWPLVRTTHPDAVAAPLVEAPRDARVPASYEDAVEELIGARLESLGPVTVAEVATSLGLPERAVAAALVGLESRGVVMRGRFTPDRGTEAPEEWCDRRVLARIHRATLAGLRREIEPVTRQVFLRFLVRWQRAEPDRRVEGAAAVGPVLEQLEGFETPAAAWESELLPARVEDYDPVWLDALCLSGRYVWGRAVPPDESERPASRPIRTSPIAILPRERADAWRAAAPARDGDGPRSPHARAVLDAIVAGGASFFDDLVRRTRLLRAQVEEALSELVAAGLVTADSFTGLRALLVPSDRRPGRDGGRRRSRPVFGVEDAGRWSLLPRPAADGDERIDRAARALLRRYGVVFRGILERESLAPPWRDLLPVYRRLEARGELRGGRFVDGFSGEQYALPEAVTALRAVRREEPAGVEVSISAADPLNLVGIVVPGPRVAAVPANRVLYRDGLPVAVLEAGQVRFLVDDLDAAERWRAASVLQRRRIPPALRAYLGRSA